MTHIPFEILTIFLAGAQKAFKKWRDDDSPKITDFIKMLPADFFKLTDSLTVARTRTMIEKQTAWLHFPKKQKPKNIFVTPKQIGNFESFEELFDHFPPMLSGYQPSFYVEQTENVDKLHDERQRDRFLVKMLYILLVKRLESSWFSFYSTTQKILNHHQNALDKINLYLEKKQDQNVVDDIEPDILEDDEFEDISDDLTLGKKRKILLSDIDKTGNLDHYKKDLKKDIEALESLINNLNKFEKSIKNEVAGNKNHKSKDDKLQSLIEEIKEKRKSGNNKGC